MAKDKEPKQPPKQPPAEQWYCPKCGAGFSTPGEVQAHWQRVHAPG